MQVVAAPDVQQFAKDYYRQWVHKLTKGIQVPQNVLDLDFAALVEKALDYYVTDHLEQFRDDIRMETYMHMMGSRKTKGAFDSYDYWKAPNRLQQINHYVWLMVKNFVSTRADYYGNSLRKNVSPTAPTRDQDFSLEALHDSISNDQEYEAFRDYVNQRYPKQIDIFKGGQKIKRDHPFTLGDILDLVYDGWSPGQIKERFEFDGGRLNIFFDKLKQFGQEYFGEGRR